MEQDIDDILKEALKLPAEARAALAGTLLDTLDDSVDQDAESAWKTEIALRLKDIDEGNERPIPWTEIFKVRPSGVLLEDGRLLLIKQSVTTKRQWSLPGGTLEHGESLEHCLVREWKEETGLDVMVRDLLYVTDRIIGKDHVVHMMFLISKTGSNPLPMQWTHIDPFVTTSSKPLREIRMVPCDELRGIGFGATFCQLVKDNFPDRGAYKGDFRAFYGEL